MGFDAANFRSSVMFRRIVKPNRFKVRIFSPPALLGAYGETVRDMELWAEAVEYPMIGLEAHQARRYSYGPPEKRITSSTFQDIRIILIADGQGQNWRFFKDWINLVFSSDSSEGIAGTYQLSYKTDYLTDLEIFVYGEEGEDEIIKTVTLTDAFPIAIEPVALQWSDNNTYMRLPITISYTDWSERV